MKSLFIVFGALMLVIALPVFFLSNHDAQTQDYTQTFAGVSTAAGVYSANVTLGQDVYDDSLVGITSITSNITGDSPTAAAFNSVSRVTTVNGLTADTIRTLSVTYEIDSTIVPAGVSAFFSISNWFYIFAILGMIAGAIYAFFD